ncbi:MAG: LacI family DNA-binding transcriptional regulator [Chthoniobacterales bacterium]
MSMLSHRKIAEALGMPASTVTNILNGTPRYKQETKDRVLQAAKELGYRPNRASLTLKRGRSNLIGIINFATMYQVGQQRVSLLRKAVNEHGYDYLAIDVDWHDGKVERVLDEIIQARVEGVVLLGHTTESFGPESLALMKRVGIPVVAMNGDDDINAPSIATDALPGFYSLVRHLHQVGHKSIIMPVIACTKRSMLERIDGFQLAMKNTGDCLTLGEREYLKIWPKILKDYKNKPVGIIIPMEGRPNQLFSQNDLTEHHYDFGKALFQSGALPDAMMCTNDAAAFGVFNAAHEMGIRIPLDLALTGADDDEYGKYPMFCLTSLRMDMFNISEEAVNTLVNRLKTGKFKESRQHFDSNLVLRKSCGRKIKQGEPATLLVPAKLPKLAANSK